MWLQSLITKLSSSYERTIATKYHNIVLLQYNSQSALVQNCSAKHAKIKVLYVRFLSGNHIEPTTIQQQQTILPYY